MKKVMATISTLCLLLGLLASGQAVFAAGETTYSVSEMTGKYKTQGRVYNTGSKLYIDWSASGIEFEAECAGDVYVNFNVESLNTTELGGCYFTVFVDGMNMGRADCRLTETGNVKMKIASGLSAGKHTFALYRQTEIGAKVSITGVTLMGSLLAAPAKKDLYIEFIGDSITAAYGNLANSSTANSGSPAYTDATQGYAYLTAKSLGADYSLVAVQGIGASVGWQSYSMLEMYPKQRYVNDRTMKYDFARQPDVVVLALGTNDLNRYSATGKTLAEVKQGFRDMLALAREKNPKAKIVWIHGMMLSSASSLITEVVAEAGGEAQGYYTLQLPQSNSGGNGHPNAAQQRTFATQLTAYIRQLTAPVPTTTTTKKTTTTTSTTKKTTTTTSTSKKTTTTTTTRGTSASTTAPIGAVITTTAGTTMPNGTTVVTVLPTEVIGTTSPVVNVETTVTETETTAPTPTQAIATTMGNQENTPFPWIAAAALPLAGVAVITLGGIVLIVVLKKRKDA